MMKAKDCSIATALVINGFLRANDGEGDLADFKNAKEMLDAPLVAALRAIRQECDDWAENISSDDAALATEAITVVLLEANGGAVSRSPYNLLSAALALAAEAIDLNGPDVVDELISRLRAMREPKSAGTLPAEQQLLVDAANALVAEIDAAVDRPVLKLAVWDNLCNQLRGQGVPIEDRVVAPANW